MSSEDFAQFFESAFEKIEPVDEVHRQKLERLREKLRESTADMLKTLEEGRSLNEESLAPPPAPSESILPDAKAEKEATKQVIGELDLHSSLIDEIVAKTKRRS